MKISTAAGLCTALALVCALVPSNGAGAEDPPQVPNHFGMPADWEQQVVPDSAPPQLVRIWLSPLPESNGFRQNVDVSRFEDVPGSIDDYWKAAKAQLAATDASLEIVASRPNDACPKSSIVIDERRMLDGRRLAVIQVATKAKATVYILTYTRLRADSPQPAALAAISKFCP